MKQGSFRRLIATLRAAGMEHDAVNVAEALWLAHFMPTAASAVPADGSESTSAAEDTADKPVKAARPAGKPAPDHSTPPNLPAPDSDEKPTPQLGPPLEGNRFASIYAPVATRGEQEFTPATAVRVVAGSALPDALALGRALRPLIRYRASRFLEVLDEEATAELTAESDRRITPVFRAVRERLLDVALVVDDSPTMAVWRKTIDAFQQLLERHGAFRDVRR